jgi:twitching motility two-component system response regulator PilH
VKKSLIVDDSMAMVRMIQPVLEGEGYRAVGSSDPSRIEKKSDSEEPNLILLDVVMAGRNGFQVCRTLKNSKTYKGIPIILECGKSTASGRNCAEQQSANGNIVKPFAPVDLLREVRRFT